MNKLGPFKNITLTASAFIAMAVLIVACGKDTPLQYNGTFLEKCKNVVCFNGGTCVDGLCQCPQGFEGVDCKDLWSSRYVGTYDAFDECVPGNNYVVTISPIANKANAIMLKNIGSQCVQQEIMANINLEKTNLEIPQQKACGNLYMSGRGTQTGNGNFVNLWLTTRDTVLKTSTYCSIVLRKK